jgi:hypothetical protein
MTPRPLLAVLAAEKPGAVSQVFIVLAFIAGAVFGIAVSFLVLAAVGSPLDTDFTGSSATYGGTSVGPCAPQWVVST